MNKIAISKINWNNILNKFVWLVLAGIVYGLFTMYATVQYEQPKINEAFQDSLKCYKENAQATESNEDVLLALDTLSLNISDEFNAINSKLKAHDKTLVYIIEKIPSIDEISKEYLKEDLKHTIQYSPQPERKDTLLTLEEMFN